MTISLARRILAWPLKQFFDLHAPWYKRRVVGQLLPLLPDQGQVLDVGCDDGFVGLSIHRAKPGLELQGVDVQQIRPCHIPRTVYDGATLPFPDNSFDVVMAMDVLHHIKSITPVLREMARVSRRLVLLKDHMSHGRFSHFMVGFGDWLANLAYGIPCAYNFPTEQGWMRHFEEASLRLARPLLRPDLGWHLSGDVNPIFLLEKGTVQAPA